MSRARNHSALLFGVIALAASAFGSNHVRGRLQRHYVASETYDPTYYLPPASWLPVISIGYREVVADLIWITTLNYYGSEIINHGPLAYAFGYVDAMVAADPHFESAYLWAGGAALYRSSNVPISDVERGIEYLERGAKLFPEDGKMQWETGATISYEYVPMLHDEAARNAAKARGMPYLERAARLGAAPDWQVLSNASTLERLGERDLAIRHLEEMYPVVQDDATRQQIAWQISRLRSAAFADAFVEVNREQVAAWQKDFPYVPIEMFALLGGRVTKSWRELIAPPSDSVESDGASSP